MGSACSSGESDHHSLDVSDSVKQPVDVQEITQNRPVSFAIENTDTNMSRKSGNKTMLKKRTYSVVRMEKHDLLELQHPEMKEVLEGFNSATEKIPTMLDKNYFDDVIDLLQDKFLKNFDDYSEPDQRELMGDHLSKIRFVTVIVDYYKFVLGTMGLEAVTEEDITVEGRGSDDGDSYSDDDDEDDRRILRLIRKVLWNFSDGSQRLGEEIANSKMFCFLIKDLQKMNKQVEKVELDDFAFMSAVNIIGNCSRSPAPLSCYTVNVGTEDNENMVEIVQCLLPFLQESKLEFVRIQTLLVLSHIVNENQFNYLTADDILVKFLIDMIDKALKAKDRRHTGFSAQELLSGLSGMARNDDMIAKIIELPNSFPLIKDVVLNGTEAEQIEACGVLHKTAFKPKNKEKIMNETKLWKKLHELQDSDHEDLSEVAKLACFTINSFKKEPKEEEEFKHLGFGGLPSPTKKDKHIMISYCQANTRKVMEIYDILVSNDFRVWMDIYNLGGESLLDGMSKAVEQASIVLICYSEDYFFSKNCRTEAEYAYDQSKEKMFARLQYKYKPTGWLGIVRGTMKYYDFSGHYNLTEKSNEFIRDLRAKIMQFGGNEGQESETSLLKQPSQTQRKPLKSKSTDKDFVLYKWTQADLDKWFKKNHLEMFAGLKKLTGAQLSFLYKVFKRAPEFFYKCLEEKLGLKSLEDLMRFSDAIEKLREEYPEIDDVLL